VRTARRDRNFRLSSLVGQQTRAPPLAADWRITSALRLLSNRPLTAFRFCQITVKVQRVPLSCTLNSSLGVDLSVVPKTLPPQHQPAIWSGLTVPSARFSIRTIPFVIVIHQNEAVDAAIAEYRRLSPFAPGRQARGIRRGQPHDRSGDKRQSSMVLARAGCVSPIPPRWPLGTTPKRPSSTGASGSSGPAGAVQPGLITGGRSPEGGPPAANRPRAAPKSAQRAAETLGGFKPLYEISYGRLKPEPAEFGVVAG
jgi:hypothetical protein